VKQRYRHRAIPLSPIIFQNESWPFAMSVFTLGIFLGSGLALAIGAGLVANLPKEGTVYIPILGYIYHWQTLFLIIGLPGW
jgi:hypothetical protein